MLAIDVGNTHITSAVIEGACIGLVRRIPTDVCLESGSFFDHLNFAGENLPRIVALSSVRSRITEIITGECEKDLGRKPLVVTNTTPMGIINLYGSKDTLGTDRLVDAAACHHFHTKGKRPGIIIDMGTATTIDYITEQGEFLGGAIVPGIISAYRGLRASAPELPEIEISKVDSLIGTTTEDCIRSGVIAGHAALVRELSSLMAKGMRSDPLVVVTGGLAALVDEWMPADYIRDQDLTIKGLFIIYELNKKSD